MQVSSHYINQTDFALKTNLTNYSAKNIWTESLFQQYKASLRNKTLQGTYGVTQTLALEELLKKHMLQWIVGGRALVIGSEGEIQYVSYN